MKENDPEEQEISMAFIMQIDACTTFLGFNTTECIPIQVK